MTLYYVYINLLAFFFISLFMAHNRDICCMILVKFHLEKAPYSIVLLELFPPDQSGSLMAVNEGK